MLAAKWTHTDIKNEDDLLTMIDFVKSELANIIAGAFDTETTGLSITHGKPFLFQFGFVTKFMYGYTYTVDLEVTPELAKRCITIWHMLAKQFPIYLGHNIKFDLHMLTNIGIPYTGNNVSDTQAWIRLGCDAVQVDKGGPPLQLKAFAARYITKDAKDMESLLKTERTQIAQKYNNMLKRRTKLTKKVLDDFFKDKLNDVEDMPEDMRKAYMDWLKFDVPDWLLGRFHGTIDSDDVPYNKLNRENVKYYGHLDIVWTIETWLCIKPVIDLRGNTENIKYENDQIYPLLRMERVGYPCNFDYLEECRVKVKQYIRRRRQDLCDLAGVQVKVGQSKLILEILHDLGVDVDTTESEALSIACSNLKRNNSNPTAVEFIETLQELRTLEKWYSTYICRFLEERKDGDDRIYTQINPEGTVSGRVTCDFQQFPKKAIKDIDGNVLFHPRHMVYGNIGDYKGIVYLDYSQIELRLQAFYTILVGSPDKNLCQAYMPYLCVRADGTKFDYNNPQHIKEAYDGSWINPETNEPWVATDVHGATTKAAFDIDESNPEFHDLRYVGKRVNFAKNYGASKACIRSFFPEYDDATIEKIDAAYYKAFPGVEDYHNYVYRYSKEHAYMQNMFGVKYYGASGHNLINMLVQGTGAYYLKQKIVLVDKYLIDHKCKSKLCMQIHDELQFLWHKDDDPQIFFDIKHIMEDWEDTKVPIVADMELTTSTWDSKVEVESVGDFYKV